MEVVKQTTLDLLDIKTPSLSATSDVPVIETKPDATPVKEVPVVPAAETKEEPKTAEPASAEPATEDSSATPDEAKKPAKGVQKRIDELTRQREDERRAREAAEARELRILGALEKVSGVTPPPPGTDDTEPVKPVKAAYDNPDAYDQAIEEYVTQRAAFIARREVKSQIEAQEKKRVEEAQLAQTKRVQEEFQKRVDKVKEKYSDYQEVTTSDVQVSFPMAYAILNSEQGPEIQYYLGKNPAEATRISAMTDMNGNPDVARQLVELGVISARINVPVTPPKPVSAAPAPIKPISGASETVKSPEEESMEEYATRRKKELNSVRPGVRH